MNERDIFIAALDKATAEERSGYLSVACAGNSLLRERVEGLLQMHEQTGDFLQKPVVERLADGVAAREDAAETARNQSATTRGDQGVGFLAPSNQPGSLGRLGHYEVQEVIGSGGMGVVLRAFDEKLHRVVAIKVMAAPLATSAAARKRFLREARAAAAVCHDHIVTIHAVEESGDLPYLVMQCVSGMSLQQRIDRDGPLALYEILRIGMQTAAGLAAAHAQGLIHRDIKPANILLENGVERVKITDFGLARAAADASDSQTGIIAGTPQYMAPEQARGQALDCRTDLFSLGSVLYAMCTGRAPFRASNSMAVLKRVCDEAPSPIREANSEVPDWLIAIIDRLMAKQPDERFQTAAEVADLLSQHLAHLQHPSSAALPVIFTPTKKKHRAAAKLHLLPHHRLHVALAGAALVCLAVSLGLAEATGVTHLGASVIRIFTPSGTLVVETDDPAVKVTIEGDGGLVITGAGPHEVRLKPGSYKLQADKNGQPVPLERELVSIAKGGREVVKVKLERPAVLSATKSAKGAFVLLTGGAEQKFDTLAEAAQSASQGDTIEVRGNGPFVSNGVTIRHSLVIRAGGGYTPSITLSQAAADRNTPLLSASAPLVLEGLELRRMGGADGRFSKLIDAWHPIELYIGNCRLVFDSSSPVLSGNLIGTRAAVLVARNCELSGNVGYSCQWHYAAGGRCTIENCVSASGAFGFHHHDPDLKDVSIRVHGNTIAGDCMSVELWSKPNTQEGPEATPQVRLDFSRNVIRLGDAARKKGVLYFHLYQLRESFSAAEAESLLPRLVRLEEKQNVYRTRMPLLVVAADWRPLGGKRGRDLADWEKFWGEQNTGSVEGDVRFQGGDLITRTQSDPERLTAEDFRLQPDSAGYRAGDDGKDLGADVDLVGPGLAYERWKQTPEYEQWLNETGQMK